MSKGILRSNLLYCDHLGVSTLDRLDVASFSVDRPEGLGLVEYLQHSAFSDETQGTMRSYVVRDLRTSEVVGYFSLKTGLISVNEREIVIRDSMTGREQTIVVFDTIPGVELANFAVNSSYLKKRPSAKGIGLIIFNQFVLPIVRKTAEYVAVKILYIFALPYESLINNYKVNYGFERLNESDEKELHKRLKPAYDDSCIFMYMML